jgi:murein L,D-transpeptidase YafK
MERRNMESCGHVGSVRGNGTRIVRGFAALVLGFCLMAGSAPAGTKMPESVVVMEGKTKTVLVVEKKTQTLFVYTREGEEVQVRKMACSTGKGHGDKKMAGDDKTPEGVYFFVGKLKGRKVPRGYGKLAFQLDYPNSLDDAAAEKGKPLFFRGTDKELKPMETDGGVAVENKDILSLENEISLEDTPMIIIEENGKYQADDNRPLVEGLDRFLAGWVKSMSEGTYHEILSHYSPDYMPDMGWWNAWNRNRNEARSHGASLACGVSDRSYFTDSGVYVALFRLNLVSGDTVKNLGMRKLYIQPEKDSYIIVGDETRKLQAGDPLADASRTLCKAAEVEKKDTARQDILEMLNGWKTAWASSDMDRYGEFYAESFRSSGLTRKAWIEKKRKLSTINRNIEITIEKPAVQFKKNKARVRFKEIFKSSGYSSVGIKTLILVKDQERWKILSEDWVRK